MMNISLERNGRQGNSRSIDGNGLKQECQTTIGREGGKGREESVAQ